jgi:putative intracellular protease/amidase
MNKPTRKSAQMTAIGFAVLLGEWFGDAYFPLTKEIEALIIPSGPQWRKFNENPIVLAFIRNAHAAGLIVASFCVGNTTVKAAGLVDLPSGPELYPDKVPLVKERVLLGPRGGGPPPGDGFESAPIEEICDAVAREVARSRAASAGPARGRAQHR